MQKIRKKTYFEYVWKQVKQFSLQASKQQASTLWSKSAWKQLSLKASQLQASMHASKSAYNQISFQVSQLESKSTCKRTCLQASQLEFK